MKLPKPETLRKADHKVVADYWNELKAARKTLAQQQRKLDKANAEIARLKADAREQRKWAQKQVGTTTKAIAKLLEIIDEPCDNHASHMVREAAWSVMRAAGWAGPRQKAQYTRKQRLTDPPSP